MLVRVQEVFNSILDLGQATVRDVRVEPDGVVAHVALRGPHRCPCGQEVYATYDSTLRRWRHLDVAGKTMWIEATLARVRCEACQRVRTVEVPWARTGARFTRAFEQHVAWLAQRMDLSGVARLMRCGWDSIHRIVGRVVAEHLTPTRFEGLRHIGVDETSYRRGHKYLTVVIDHDRRRVVWVGEGKSADTLAKFYTELGHEGCAQLVAVTMDGGKPYRRATTEHAPQAVICMDPFHVMQWANEALDQTFAASRIAALKTQLATITGNPLRAWRTARHAVRAGQERLEDKHRDVLKLLRSERADLYTDWQYKEELRDLFHTVGPDLARAYLDDWLTRTRRGGSPAMFTLANKIAKHADLIVNGLEHGLTNARLEGTNTRIKAIQRRGYGMPNPTSLTAMIYLCCGNIDIQLPTAN